MALNDAMRAWAAGDLHCMAAVELLIEHGTWPGRLDAIGLVPYGKPRLDTALLKLDDPDDFDLYTSSSELRVLQIAASLIYRRPVVLRDVLVGLDRVNSRLVALTFERALGIVTLDMPEGVK